MAEQQDQKPEAGREEKDVEIGDLEPTGDVSGGMLGGIAKRTGGPILQMEAEFTDEFKSSSDPSGIG
jgi:hypothetical protein